MIYFYNTKDMEIRDIGIKEADGEMGAEKHAEDKHLDRIADKLRENDEKQRELLVAERLGLNYDYLQRSKKQRDASFLREIQDMNNEREREAEKSCKDAFDSQGMSDLEDEANATVGKTLQVDPNYLKRETEKRKEREERNAQAREDMRGWFVPLPHITSIGAPPVESVGIQRRFEILEARTKQLSTTILWLAVFMVLSIALFLFAPNAEAQYADPYSPRPVAVFEPGQEEECEDHWQDDFHILRAWQSENFYWEGQFNLCAEMLGLGSQYWPTNPTMEKYEVPMTVIEDEVEEGRYSTFIESCNAHVKAAHLTENQFADATHQVHINYCHCRATLGLGACTADFLQRFPYRFQPRLFN